MRRGNGLVWLSAGVLAFAVLMIGGLVGLIAARGLGFFWPAPLVLFETPAGPVLGEVADREPARGGEPGRIQLRVGNRDLFGQDFRWYPESELRNPTLPEDALMVERSEYGVFLGRVKELRKDGLTVSTGPAALDEALERLPGARKAQAGIRAVEKGEVGRLNTALEAIRLERKALERRPDPARQPQLDAREAELRSRYADLEGRLDHLRAEAKRLTVLLEAWDGQVKEMPLPQVVRLVPSNRLGLPGKLKVYASRLWEFVSDDPRESNTEGGIFPAIFGTVMMVLLMSALGVPLGVLAALYLREYARDGWLVRAIRVAVNNLAGVPSIVFGVFGLGFFVYTLGGSLDRLFFPERLPTPTFGTGGILWASLTLALLTVPVVIVATEEALAAVPRFQREASMALGATKWQTLWNIVLPGAMPGILTGLILAMARGAGEVAPLMLTGVVKLAPSMPLDGTFPFLHLDRKFMHLGFHIYDVGFQSPNSEAAKPMVFMTTLLLLAVVVALNLAAIRIRRRLRARLGGSTF
ncbi:MAG: phosphate ABC transporter permease PstA [Acidobacteria bacterium]|nr:phosphate ABC transporter permease PstA [Acidobacteriota bacterium]